MIQATIHLDASHLPWYKRPLYWLRPKKYQINLPEQWKEMPEPAFRYLMYLKTKGELVRKQDKLMLLQKIMQLPDLIYMRISVLDFYEKLLPRLSWCFDAPITFPVIRSIRVGEQLLAMPYEKLKYVTLSDFVLCEAYYQRALSGQEGDDVLRFVASVLRTYAPIHQQAGEVRVKNSEALVESNYQKMKQLTPNEVMYVLTFWTDCRLHLKEKYPEAFDSDAKEEATTTNWQDVFTDLAETGVFGSLQDVESMSVHTFYAWLAKKRRQQKAEQKKAFQEMMMNQHNKAFA